MKMFAQRLLEASTWRGLVMAATAMGITISPEMLEAILAVGTGLTGLIGILTPDRPV